MLILVSLCAINNGYHGDQAGGRHRWARVEVLMYLGTWESAAQHTLLCQPDYCGNRQAYGQTQLCKCARTSNVWACCSPYTRGEWKHEITVSMVQIGSPPVQAEDQLSWLHEDVTKLMGAFVIILMRRWNNNVEISLLEQKCLFSSHGYLQCMKPSCDVLERAACNPAGII